MRIQGRLLIRLFFGILALIYFGLAPASADTAVLEGGYYGTEIKKALDYLKSFGGDPKDPNSPISIHKKLTERFESLNVIVKDIPESGVHGLNYWSSRKELILDTSLFAGSPKSKISIDISETSNLFYLHNIIGTLYHEYLHSINDDLLPRICNQTSEAFTGKNHLEWRAHLATANLLTTMTEIKMKEINDWPNSVKLKDLRYRIFVLEEFIKLASAVRSTYTDLNDNGYGPKIGTEISETLKSGAEVARKSANFYKRMLKIRDRLKAGFKKAKKAENRATETPKTEDSSSVPGTVDEDATYEVPLEFAGSPISPLAFQNANTATDATVSIYTGTSICPSSPVAINPFAPVLAAPVGHVDGPVQDVNVVSVSAPGNPGLFAPLFGNPGPPTNGAAPGARNYLSFEFGGCGARSGAEVSSFQTIGGNTRTVATRAGGDGTAACGGFKFTRSVGAEGQRTSFGVEAGGILNSGTQTTTFQRDVFTPPPYDSIVNLRQGNTLITGLTVNQELGGFQGPNSQMWTWGVAAGGGVEVRRYRIHSRFDQSCCGGGVTDLSESGTMVTPYVRGGVFASTYLPGGTMFDVGLTGSYSPERQASVVGSDGFGNPIGDTVTLPGGTTVMFTGTLSVDLETIFGPAGARASDARLKQDIVRLASLVHNINLYAYRYIGDSKQRIGVMAQEVVRVYPDAIHQNEGGYYVVDYPLLFTDPDLRSALAQSGYDLRL